MKLIALLSQIKIHKEVEISNIRHITIYEGTVRESIPYFINVEKTLDYLNCEVTHYQESDYKVDIEVDHFTRSEPQVPVSQALMIIKKEWGEGVYSSFELFNASEITYDNLCDRLTILHDKIKFAFSCITSISKEHLALETAIDNEYEAYIREKKDDW